eukprot:scaffold58689_cov63-Phaeocystis_antarctica.AAC.10
MPSIAAGDAHRPSAAIASANSWRETIPVPSLSHVWKRPLTLPQFVASAARSFPCTVPPLRSPSKSMSRWRPRPRDAPLRTANLPAPRTVSTWTAPGRRVTCSSSLGSWRSEALSCTCGENLAWAPG